VSATTIMQLSRSLFRQGLFKVLERGKIILKFVNGVTEIDVVSLQEGMNLHPGSKTEHAPHLPFRQVFAAVSLQCQGFKGGAREVWLLVLDHARDVVRDLELHVHTAQLSHYAVGRDPLTRKAQQTLEASGRICRNRYAVSAVMLFLSAHKVIVIRLKSGFSGGWALPGFCSGFDEP
jgi:hypothetical protein